MAKNKKLIFPLLIIVCMAVLAVAVLLRDRSDESLTAEEYFDISRIMYTGEKTNSHLMVYPYVVFNLSAVQGDATEIVITNIPGMSEDVYVGTINQTCSKTVSIELRFEVVLAPTENGFPFRVRISCHELYDWVTIYLQWPPPQTAS